MKYFHSLFCVIIIKNQNERRLIIWNYPKQSDLFFTTNMKYLKRLARTSATSNTMMLFKPLLNLVTHVIIMFFPSISRKPSFEPDKMKFVYDVLDMYRLLGDSYNKLPMTEKETIDSRSVLFPGFDGNNECEYLSYASYLINELNLYSESKRPDLNTHAPYLWNYKKMLSKLNKIKGSEDYRLLASDEIAQIIE